MSDFKTLLAVGDLASPKMSTISGTDKIANAAKRMLQENASSLLVLEADGKLVGIVTEQDIVYRAVAKDVDLNKMDVTHIMTPNPVKIAADESIFEAKKLMLDNKVNHLIVVNDGKPVGILTSQTIMGS
ncbi:MAG: CBS domain-containing protein [Nitrospinae bacterium]|nr:CBS domain-containing protein [Nitrospinota bacterium]